MESRPCGGVCCRWIEARADFEIALDELRDADRGAADADLDALDLAAHRIAVAENVAVFHGWSGAITGITEASPHAPVPLGASPQDYPSAVAAAIERLLGSGIAGPYALALGDEQHRLVIETAEHGGYPMLEHLRKILDGPIVWAPGVRGAVLVSQRGGDFLLDCGQDLSIGYDSHDEQVVRLYSAGELQLPGGDGGRGGPARQPLGLSTSSSLIATSMSAPACARREALRGRRRRRSRRGGRRSSCRSRRGGGRTAGTTG